MSIAIIIFAPIILEIPTANSVVGKVKDITKNYGRGAGVIIEASGNIE
ncbi:unnamed protein product, partial [marine sediment metagenome]